MGADSSFIPPSDLVGAALDLLQQDAGVTEQDIEQARKIASERSTSVLVTLNQIGVVSDDRLANVFATLSKLPIYSAEFERDDYEPPALLNPEFMRSAPCFLVSATGPLLVVDPFDERLSRAVEFALGAVVPRQIIRAGDWRHLFEKYYPSAAASYDDVALEEDEFSIDLADQSRDAPIVRQVSTWLSDAADAGASDVHFDTKRNSFEVLFRQDGSLRPVSTQPKSMASNVMTRVKVIANLDLGERNKAQDGRSTIVVRGRRLDVRVSVIPTIDGESAVIRLLDRDRSLLSLKGLGFDDGARGKLADIMSRRHGMFVVAGPTGSGKTTTLYACIEMLKGRGLKILSVEDPVEYHFDHVSQVQISEKAGRTFASALRSFLRHDPDVILVGEIRDPETAAIAVQASMSGHLVLATLHAIDSTRIRTRLIDMGVEPFKLDACLVGAVSQRLVRRLCPHCRELIDTPSVLKEALSQAGLVSPEQIWHASGCDQCDWEGYQGRIALADFIDEHAADGEGGLRGAALQLALRGETSFQEVEAFVR